MTRCRTDNLSYLDKVNRLLENAISSTITRFAGKYNMTAIVLIYIVLESLPVLSVNTERFLFSSIAESCPSSVSVCPLLKGVRM